MSKHRVFFFKHITLTYNLLHQRCMSMTPKIHFNCYSARRRMNFILLSYLDFWVYIVVGWFCRCILLYLYALFLCCIYDAVAKEVCFVFKGKLSNLSQKQEVRNLGHSKGYKLHTKFLCCIFVGSNGNVNKPCVITCTCKSI